MSDEPGRRAPAPASGRGVSPVATFAGGVLAGVVVTAVIVAFVIRPIGAPPRSPERVPTPDASTPAPAATPGPPPTAPAVTSQPEPSRSRGRADWLFFFKPGDQLVRMGDDTAMGMVIRTIPGHAFPDGTVGPAYVLQLPDGGGQRVVDADELERGGRLQ